VLDLLEVCDRSENEVKDQGSIVVEVPERLTFAAVAFNGGKKMERLEWEELESRVSALEFVVAELFREKYRTEQASDKAIQEANRRMRAVAKRWRPPSAKNGVERAVVDLHESIKKYREFYKEGWGED
jgi:hypothetical protein